LSGDCFTVVQDFDAIVDQMTVPLIQGMLKYAYKSDPANDQGSCTAGSCDKEWAEGWAFAAAVLPRLHYCSFEVADMVRMNLDTSNAAPMKDGFAALKAHVEDLYPCLGITCADVGEFQNAAGVYAGAEACDDDGAPLENFKCPAPDATATAAPGATATEPPATEPPATDPPTGTNAPAADTTASPTEPALDYQSLAFAALTGFVFMVNA
jgi:hypothetical protein